MYLCMYIHVSCMRVFSRTYVHVKNHFETLVNVWFPCMGCWFPLLVRSWVHFEGKLCIMYLTPWLLPGLLVFCTLQQIGGQWRSSWWIGLIAARKLLRSEWSPPWHVKTACWHHFCLKLLSRDFLPTNYPNHLLHLAGHCACQSVKQDINMSVGHLQSKKWHCPGHSTTHARVCK